MTREVYLIIATDTGAFIESNKMDRHADTCCIGKHCVFIYYTGKVYNVHGYTAKLGSMKNIKGWSWCHTLDRPHEWDVIYMRNTLCLNAYQ